MVEEVEVVVAGPRSDSYGDRREEVDNDGRDRREGSKGADMERPGPRIRQRLLVMIPTTIT